MLDEQRALKSNIAPGCFGGINDLVEPRNLATQARNFFRDTSHVLFRIAGLSLSHSPGGGRRLYATWQFGHPGEASRHHAP